jgi:hypothetical protein
MIIDKKGKLFGKVSVVDVIILLIVLLAAVAGYNYMISKNASTVSSKTDRVELVFYGEEAPTFAIDAVKQGDVARDHEKGTVFGNVTEDIKKDKAKKYTDNDEGQKITLSREGYSSYYLTVEGNGVASDTGVIMGGSEYQIGKLITIRVGNAIFQGNIHSYKKKG